MAFLDRHAQRANAGALKDGSKCYAEVGLKAVGNICQLARSGDGTVCLADSLAAMGRCSRADDDLLATVTRLVKVHAKVNPTITWVSNNVMKICMQTYSSSSLFDPNGDPGTVASVHAAGLHA